MQQDFWLERWNTEQIGFHQNAFNPHLTRLWPDLLEAPGRVLVPLCGKSRDMIWLRDNGYSVVGVEWSQKAVVAFFEENALAYERTDAGAHQRYAGEDVEILCGDFMSLDTSTTGTIDAVFDRASMIALPADLRQPYADTLARLLRPGARCLTILIEYEDRAHQGPPFSINASTLNELVAESFDVTPMLREDGELRPGHAVTTAVYRLTKRS